MRWAVLVIGLLAGVSVCSSQSSLSDIRKAFFIAETEDDLEAIIEMTCRHKQHDSVNIFRAYQAVAETRMAKHVFWPFKKLSYFNNGKDTLEACIGRSRNLETVYLRHIVQLNAPGILGYCDNLKADRRFIDKEMAVSILPRSILDKMRESIKQ